MNNATTPEPSENRNMEPVYVYGSNLSGVHEKGPAAIALRYHGAENGKGSGPAGNSYAIPLYAADGQPLPLSIVRNYVDSFINYAGRNTATRFFVNRLSCEGEDCPDEKMAALFKAAPANCQLPGVWLRHLRDDLPARLIVLDASSLISRTYIQERLDQCLCGACRHSKSSAPACPSRWSPMTSTRAAVVTSTGSSAKTAISTARMRRRCAMPRRSGTARI